MSQYLYRVIMYYDTSSVMGLDVASNNADVADYQTNYRADTLKVSSIQLVETTFEIDTTYTWLKSKIVSPITWGDVSEVPRVNGYELVLITSEAL